MSNDNREAELKKLREARAKLAEARAQREESEAIEAQIEAERRGLQDDEAIAAAIEEHGAVGKGIEVVQTDLGAVIVKRPNAVLYKRFMDSGSSKYEEFDKLVRPTLVYPAKARWDEMLDEKPAILLSVATAVCKLAGARLGELAGK